MNLVVGATGVLGGEICSRLAKAGKPVRALVRTSSNPERVDALRKAGVELAMGDLTDRASLDAACRGVSTVYSTATAIQSRQEGNTLDRVDREGQANLIDAARIAGIQRFVFISFRGRPDFDYPLQAAKRATSERLKKSGIPWTIIEASMFMEIWLGPHLGFDAKNARARIFGSGEKKISWVSYRDVAAVAIAAGESPAGENQTLEIGGPEALSPLEVVRIFEEQGGKKFELEHVPEKTLIEAKANARNPVEETFAGLQLFYARGFEVDSGPTLDRFPMRLTTVREFADRVLAG
ncbi:MAG TPA: SDR family oxidoreductase [Thermoanaerobaculia bacterium]|nr:SDR family oxidoreductase [Thermoanaerobaculia bacterium]